MEIVADTARPSRALALGSVAVSLLVAAVFGYLWFARRETADGLVALSFLLRTPVFFNHPFRLQGMKEPLGGSGSRLTHGGRFSMVDSLLSIAGFILLVLAIGLYAWRAFAAP